MIRSVLDRLRSADRRRLDLIAGVVLVVEAQLELLVFLDSGVDPVERTLAHFAVMLPAIAVMLRSRAPAVSGMLGVSLFPAITWMSSDVNYAVNLPFLTVFAVMFSAAVLTGDRGLYLTFGYALIAVVISLVTDPIGAGAGDVVFALSLLVGGPWLAGRTLRNRLRLAEVMRERTLQLEMEAHDAVERATVEERERIAGELHDLVSHTLTGMVVQSSGARMLVARDPGRASEAFAAIEASGRDALTEMRRLLGVLRHDDEEIALAPQPSIAHLDALTRQARSGGLAVELVEEGDRPALPAGADLIAYRVIQQALRAAREKGGAGAATVTLRYAPSAIRIEIADDGTGERPLLSVQERVTLYGGQMLAGRRREGGHLVRATINLGAAG